MYFHISIMWWKDMMTWYTFQQQCSLIILIQSQYVDDVLQLFDKPGGLFAEEDEYMMGKVMLGDGSVPLTLSGLLE